jgi:hypothetical protein
MIRIRFSLTPNAAARCCFAHAVCVHVTGGRMSAAQTAPRGRGASKGLFRRVQFSEYSVGSGGPDAMHEETRTKLSDAELDDAFAELGPDVDGNTVDIPRTVSSTRGHTPTAMGAGKEELATMTRSEVDAASARERRRLSRLHAPGSVKDITDNRSAGHSSFVDVVDALQEWRSTVRLLTASKSLKSGSVRETHARDVPANAECLASSETALGEVQFRLSTNSARVTAAFLTQVSCKRLASSTTDDTASSLFPVKLFARPQVMALVGDVVSSEQASARHVTNPTPVEAGSSSSDWTPLTQAPSPLSQDSTTADEFGTLARSSGTAFQRVTTIRAALKFEERAHDRAQFAPRSQDKAGSENLGAPNFRPSADTEALALAKQKYVNEATERLSAFPLTAIDASFRRTMLVCGDTRVAVRRDVLRYGLNAGFFGNVVPLLHAVLLDATAVSEVATGRTVLILGPRRSGRTTLAMHAIAAGRGRIGLVADGVTAMCAGSSALDAGFGLDWGRGSAAIASERVTRILAALQRAPPDRAPVGSPDALADNDVVLLGAPLHPLVCAGSLCAPRGSSGPASAQLRAYAIAAKKASNSDSAVAFDACDSAWLQHGLHWMDDDRVSAKSRWNSQASIRVDLTTCFGHTASSSSAQLQPCAGRLAGVLILDWKTPSDDAVAARGLAVPMNTEASTNPLTGSHGDPFANDSPSTTVSRFDMQRPDAREGLVTWLTTNTCAPLLHRQLRPLRRAGLSAADAADLLATIADADPDERADPQLLGSAYAKAAAELFVRRLEDARQEVPVLSLHGDAVNFCDATRTVVRDLLHIE